MAEPHGQSPDAGALPPDQLPPPPPVPASDPSLFAARDDPRDAPSPRLASLADDIFDVTPLAALQLLGAGVEALVRITGDIPPTPPGTGASPPTNMRAMQAEKEVIVRTLSENSLKRLREAAEADDARRRRKPAGDRSTPPRDEDDKAEAATDSAGTTTPSSAATATTTTTTATTTTTPPTATSQNPSTPTAASRSRLPPTPPPARPLLAGAEIDGVRLRAAAAAASPSSSVSASSEPYTVIGANSQPLNVQHSAIARKFYSKKAPPISISEYLLRLHRFCPMSTGVYLATSIYIYRLAVAEKTIAVTRRNVHRLLLAGLRVAMKALEDLSYAHVKMARVGGVTEAELARLEISFCFLAGFELAIGADDMRQHWVLMKSGRAVGSLDPDGTAAVLASMDARGVPRRSRAQA